MISKELLSEVVGHEVVEVGELEKDEDYAIPMTFIFVKLKKYHWVKINIHELAHKCKEWAFLNYRSIKIIETIDRIRVRFPTKEFDSGIDNALRFDKLPPEIRLEILFKSLEWALEQKDSQC